jgi:hypothetical protein
MTDRIENSGHHEAGKKSPLKKNHGNFLKKWVLPMITVSLLFGLMCDVKHEINSMKQLSQLSIAHEADILTALNDLSMKIEKLSADQVQIAELKAQVSHIEHTMMTEQSLSTLAKASELQKVTAQLTQLMHAPLSPAGHRASVHSLRKKSAGPAPLPFQVLSVDSISGQKYASVQYHQDTLPLRLNDQLAGWTAVRLDSLTGIAVWENAQRRRITTAMTERNHV